MNSGTILNALFGFNQATNDRLWNLIMANLTDEEFTQANAYSRGSIRNQLVHMADAQHYWLRSMLDMDMPELPFEDYPTREAARAICQQSDQTILDTVRGISEADLERVVEGWGEPVWIGLMQVGNHSTDHRSQILRALWDMGKPTLEQNFALYMEYRVPMTVATMLTEISTKQGEWDDLLRQVSPEHVGDTLVQGWSVRDAVAVVTWKERRAAEIVRNRAVINFSFGELPEADQSRILSDNRALPLDTLLDQQQAAHHDLLDAVRALTDAEANADEGIPNLPEDERFWKLIGWATWMSYPTFINPLREMVKKASK